MLKKLIRTSQRLDMVPAFSFSERRRGLKYKTKRQFDRNEPCYYVPLQQGQSKKNEFMETIASSEKTVDRYSFHPHSYWLTHGKGSERPFTGAHWDRKDVGDYNCVVCSNKLFTSDHKFQAPTGVASFWNAINGSIELVDDFNGVKEDKTNLTTKLYDHNVKKQRCICSKCKSHLGVVTQDGPPPLFLRYSINSGSLDFSQKPWFHPPQYYRQLRLKEKETKLKEKDADIVDKFQVDREKLREIEGVSK